MLFIVRFFGQQLVAICYFIIRISIEIEFFFTMAQMLHIHLHLHLIKAMKLCCDCWIKIVIVNYSMHQFESNLVLIFDALAH